MPFAIPMVWREQTTHISDCYFCMVPPLRQGFSKKKKWTLSYPHIPSTMLPVPHGEGLPVPEPPEIVTLESENERKTKFVIYLSHLHQNIMRSHTT
jgi:hypothetical protein